MATVIRAKISEKNKYYLDKHRHYELKHFCLQYPEWKRAYSDSGVVSLPSSSVERSPSSNLPGDPTARQAMIRSRYRDRIELIEQIAKETDQCLWNYILKGVTEGLPYTYLKSVLGIPCGRDMYYERYRKFFWLLSEKRD